MSQLKDLEVGDDRVVQRKGGMLATTYDFLMMPGAIVLALVFVVPLVTIVIYSFGTVDIVGRPHLGTSLANYREVLQTAYLPIVIRTAVLASIATMISLLLGYPVAYFASRFAGRWGTFLVVAIIMTWLVDYLVRIYAWTALLAPNGLLVKAGDKLSLPFGGLLGTNVAVVIGLVYTYMPLMILAVYASLGSLDPSMIEAGKDLYGTPSRTFWHVTLPATRQGVIGGILLVLLPSLGDFAVAQLLGGVNSTMIGNLISQSFVDTGQVTFAAAMTTVLLTMLAVVLLVVLVTQRRHASGQTPSAHPDELSA